MRSFLRAKLRSSRWVRSAATGAGLAVAGLVASCAVLLDFGPQCTSDDECASRGLTGYTCSAESVCVAPSSTGSGGSGGSNSSVSSGGGGTQVVCSADECCSNAQCSEAFGGDPWICREVGKPCVSLASPDCSKEEIFGNYKDPNAIIVGALVERTDPDDYKNNTINMNIMELAVKEYTDKAIGAPGGPNNSRRPFVVVTCDTIQDYGRALNHLIHDIGVPAILGPPDDLLVLDIATNYTIPNGVMLMCGACESVSYATLPDNTLGWQTTVLRTTEGRAMGRLTPSVEKDVRARYGLQPSEKVKVALLAVDVLVTQEAGDAVEETLTFNGKPALENGSNYLRLNYTVANFPQVLEKVISFAPHIILIQGGTEPTGILIPVFEDHWKTDQPRPFYFSSDVRYVPNVKEHLDDDGLRTRFRATMVKKTDLNRAATESFYSRYRGTYPDPNLDPTGHESWYDAAYLLFHGIAAAGPVPRLTGAEIAKGISRLMPPAPIKFTVGPQDITGVILALSSNSGNIDLEGTYSQLNFDTNLGIPKGDFDVWCPSRDENGEIYINEKTGQSYDAEADKVVGEFSCP